MNIHNVEQGTEDWLKLRAGVPTASEFSKIITSAGKASTQLNTYAAQLAAEFIAGKPLERWEGNQWTERGKNIEAEAREAYAFDYGVEVAQVGFVTNHGAGCSPDGLVGDEGLVEIKCLSPAQHVLVYDFWHRNGGIPADYLPQNRGQMWVCDRQWNEMFFYYPDPLIPSFRHRIFRDATFDAQLRMQVAKVLAQRDAFVKTLTEIR
jgi:hypothetical protein